MRILILGAGTSGRMLAGRLCADRHDVTLIDRDPTALEQVDAQLDVLTVTGDVSDPRTLEQADITRCDMVAALTDQESVNILACVLAHIAGVEKKIARVSNAEYTNQGSPFNLRKLGIDLVINQQVECANDLYNILRIPGAQEVVDLLDGRALCVGIQLPTDTPLLMCPLKDYPQPELLATVRFVAYLRGGTLKIPTGETHFTIGDIVYVIGEPQKIQAFLGVALPSEEPYTRVVIAGGGELGLQLAKRLESTPLDVTLLERDPMRADLCSEQLDHTLVIQGSALDHETMQELGINHKTAFVAVTGNDENNIMSCLVAEKMGAHFTTARVDNASYTPIIDSLALLDRTVSPHKSLINAIYHFVRGSHVRGDRLLTKIQGEVMEVALTAEHAWTGKTVKSLSLPKGSIISMVLRGQHLLVATGDLMLLAGDNILLYGLPTSFRKLNGVLG